MEFDRTPNALREELCRQPFEAREGHLDVPETPGLGIEVEATALERFTVSHISCG